MRVKSPWYKNIPVSACARGPRKNTLSSNDNAVTGHRSAFLGTCGLFLLSRLALVYLPAGTTESNSKMPFPWENTFRSNPVTVIYGRGWKARSSVDRERSDTRISIPLGNTGDVFIDVLSFFVIVTWMLSADKTSDVTINFLYKVQYTHKYISCCMISSISFLWIRSYFFFFLMRDRRIINFLYIFFKFTLIKHCI